MEERTYLVEKVERELDEYKNHLMSLSKEEIMLASYQTSIKECITGYIVSEIDTMSDSYEGKESYEKVLAEQDYYLAPVVPENALLLASGM